VVAEEERRSRSADPDRGTADQPLPRKHPFCKTNSRSARAKSKEDEVVAAAERGSRSADPDRGTADQPLPRKHPFLRNELGAQRSR